MRIALKRRLVYLILSIISFIACFLIVKLFSKNLFIRGFIGDIIVILLIYFLIKTVHDFNAFKIAFFTLVLAFTTEFLQYFKLTALLGLEHNKIAHLILGSVFDPYDLLAYFIGTILVYIIDKRLVRRHFKNYSEI